MAELPLTSHTLLARLRQKPADQDAWTEFVNQYKPAIQRWAKRGDMQQCDIEDIAQEVLSKLAEKVALFDRRQGRFRSWLRVVTERAFIDYLRERNRAAPAVGGSDFHKLVNAQESAADLSKEIEGQFDEDLLQTAMSRVEPRIEKQNWTIFESLFAGLSAKETAEKAGVRISHVYLTKNRVKNMLREELRELEDAYPDV